MNNSSPLIPQGSFAEQKNQGRARVRLAVFFIISIHIFGLLGLLIAGCRKPADPEPTVETNTFTEHTFDPTNVEVMDHTMATQYTTPVFDTNPPPPPLPPQLPVATGQEYVVVAGDTFTSIARQFNVSIRAIQDANPNVDPRRLRIGQKIIVPPPSAPAPATSVAPGIAGGLSANGGQTHTVKSGDTLTAIARQYNTTVRAIQAENNMGSSTSIKVGQVLKIPSSGAASTPAPAPIR